MPTGEIMQAIKQKVEAAKAEKNRLAAIQQHSGGCDNKLTDPQPQKQPERVTQKAAEMFNTNRRESRWQDFLNALITDF